MAARNISSTGRPKTPTPPAGAGDARWREARFRHSPLFPEVLRQTRCTLLISTYQAGKLIAVGVGENGLEFSMHQFDQVMGVAAHDDTLAIGARGQVWFMGDNADIAPQIPPAGTYDHCYLPRTATITGPIQCHEMAYGVGDDGEPELWVVNTLFACLSTLHAKYNFVPRWRPPFISALAAEDRCHLNGMAMRDGRPAAVTVMSQTDTAHGWRESKNTTGCVLDVDGGEAITTGLAMPHSPRWHGDRLLVLNSGHGTLEVVDVDNGSRAPVAAMPGFTRGLACVHNLAFVGLSRIRETAVFGGVPIAARHEELKCGVAVVDLTTGRTIATLQFESGIEEIFDVQLLPGTSCVSLAGNRPDQSETAPIWVVPSGSEASLAPAATREQVNAWLAEAEAATADERPGDAIALLRKALAARPGAMAIALRLGNALQAIGDSHNAVRAFRRAVAADSSSVPALQSLGFSLINHGRTDEGTRYLRRAQAISPSPVTEVAAATALPVIYSSEAEVVARRAQLETGIQNLLDAGRTIDTTSTLVPTNFYCVYQGRNDRPVQEQLGKLFQGVDLTAGQRPERRVRGDGERPRIGMLSAYFCNHTIGRLNLGRVERLSRQRFELVVLSAQTKNDQFDSRFAAAADEFVRVPRDIAAARTLIAEQDLDLLFFADVGMDPLTSTLVFSRMADVQCLTWGHPVTSGSPTIDYFLSSSLLEIDEADEHYTERLARRPTLGTYYFRPPMPDTTGLRASLGIPEDAHIYACPQTLFKFHPEYDPILADILRRDPKGLLVLIEGRFPYWTDLLQTRFARAMPDVAGRIRWLRSQPSERFLGLLAIADVVLDPLTFGGGNSTYEALAMGTPVVSWPGQFLRNRITRALYTKAGYPELLASSAEEYAEKAVRVVTDPEYREQVRAEIAARCHVLFEDDAEVRDLEDFFDDALAGRV